MDEPSSGLDPASRKDLWKAVKSAKQERTIILTSKVHNFISMGLFLDEGIVSRILMFLFKFTLRLRIWIQFPAIQITPSSHKTFCLQCMQLITV